MNKKKKRSRQQERAGNVTHQSFITSVFRPSVFILGHVAAFKAADLCTSPSPHSSELYPQDRQEQRSHLNLHSHHRVIFLFYKVSITFLKGGGRGAASHTPSLCPASADRYIYTSKLCLSRPFSWIFTLKVAQHH